MNGVLLRLPATSVCEKTIRDCELKIQKTLQQVKDKACLKGRLENQTGI